ncbi:MAG: hypothetical protein AB9834_02245 [Lentimicrobium sp.]
MTAPGWYNEGKKLAEGEVYAFTFEKLITLSDGEDYMVMEDPFGIRHMITYKYYLNYGLKPGTTVNCVVDKINCTGRVFLEPEHPVYKKGTKFLFEFVRIQVSADRIDMSEIVVRDIFGNEIIAEFHAGIVTRHLTDGLYCQVDGFKKGRPVLATGNPVNQMLFFDQD